MEPDRRPPPFFLVGAQRSGTTLLRLMLDHHPQIAVPHEFDFAVECVGDDGSWPELERYYAYLARHGSFRRSKFPIDRSLDYPSLIESFLRERQGEKPLVGMAVHRDLHRLPFLYPEARYIHVLRDPRDVARSVVERGWAGTVWQGARRWIEAERSWERLRAGLAPERFTELRYEALVRYPEEELERLCTFLDVGYDERMLAYPQRSRYGRPDPSLAEQWRRRMSPRAIRLVEARTGSLLEERGYAPSGEPALRVGPLDELWLSARDRLSRTRARLGRYGPLLLTAGALGRRLRLRPLEKAARRRMAAIADRQVR